MELHGGEPAGAVKVAPKGRSDFSAPTGRSSPEAAWTGRSPAAGARLPLAPALGLAGLSALLLDLSFPHPRQGWLAWIALVPFLLACRHQGAWRGALLGFVIGAAFQATLLSWATFFGPVAAVGLVLFKSAGPALLGGLLGAWRPSGPARNALFAAAAWVAMEFFQTWGPLGMTWGMLGHSQARVPVLIQVGSLVGPWGLSFVLAFTNAALAEWAARAWLAPGRPGPRAAVGEAGPALAWAAGLAAGVLLFGAWRLGHPPGPAGEPVTWGTVQVSMPQDVKWDPQFQSEIMDRLEALSVDAAAGGARVIVWPETAIPYRQFLESPVLVARVGALARRLDAYLLVGSIERASGRATYNTATLFGPEGFLRGRYDKVRLVPFGEFLPWKEYLPPLPQLDLVMNYAPGDGLRLLELGSDPFAVLICYESMVADLPRQQVIRGARFLVVPTNDAWFGHSSAAAHHFDMAIMRAVENGRPAIQAGNTGLSGFITPLGQVLAETRLDERRAVVGSLAPVSELTLYTRVGDVLAWACLGGALAALALNRFRR